VVYFDKMVAKIFFFADYILTVRIDKGKNIAMQSLSSSAFALSVAAIFALSSCQKDTEFGANIVPASVATAGNTVTSNTFHYADPVFYYREQLGDYLEKPLKNQTGTYGSYPKGLVIDRVTGAIDVNKSESGVTYRVWFKPAGSSAIQNSEVTIAGINFQSRVYNLASGDSLATPLYNVLNNRPAPSGTMARIRGSEFANDNDKAITALSRASKQPTKPGGLAIDEQTGTINLRQAVKNGLFGANPVNGTVKVFRLYYRLNDGSRKALNYIDVRLHYYSHASAVPASLLAQANYKTRATFRQAPPMPAVGDTLNVSDTETNMTMSIRPPEVVIIP
jgi:hypothetical protein